VRRIGIAIIFNPADPVPFFEAPALLHKPEKPPYFPGVKKSAVLIDNLKGVPLDRIMARRNDNAAAGMKLLYHDLDSGSWNNADVNNCAS